MKYFSNILSYIFKLYSLISFIGILSATILTVNGYYYLGRLPSEHRGYSVKGFVNSSPNHSESFLAFIDHVNDCMGLTLLFGFILVIPAMLFGYYKLFKIVNLENKIGFIFAFIFY